MAVGAAFASDVTIAETLNTYRIYRWVGEQIWLSHTVSGNLATSAITTTDTEYYRQTNGQGNWSQSVSVTRDPKTP